jgi:hypothetical protein
MLVFDESNKCNALPSICLPLSSLTLGDIVKSLLAVVHHNGMAGIFTIGMLLVL